MCICAFFAASLPVFDPSTFQRASPATRAACGERSHLIVLHDRASLLAHARTHARAGRVCPPRSACPIAGCVCGYNLLQLGCSAFEALRRVSCLVSRVSCLVCLVSRISFLVSRISWAVLRICLRLGLCPLAFPDPKFSLARFRGFAFGLSFGFGFA